MEADLIKLEDQLEQLIARYTALREENRNLRLRTAELEVRNHALAAKVREAVTRVEAVLERLPETETDGNA
ncbi:MAG: hypothetical protein JNJ44_01220 [Zoogloeaceae bacterium]|nr:hypothetical protein [Zoogloeaceae bacterium]